MIVARAPFRIPIGGGGTDLPSYYSRFGGHLVTAAINKYMYMSVNAPACISHISVKYSQTENVQRVDEIKHNLVRETLRYLDFSGPVEICSMADAGAGTGLGSSGAFTVALLTAMNTLMQSTVDKQTIARQACHIEMDRVGSPVGKQDQYASALGGIFAMDIEPNGDVSTRRLSIAPELLTELQYRLVMFYTSIQRSANDVLQDQQSKIESDDSRATQAMHQIKSICIQIEDALKSNDVDAFGKLMHNHWQVKKSISEKMSNSSINSWYELAMRNGALGGKIMGAGGGGFFIFCCQEGRRRKLIEEMERSGLRYIDFAFDFEGAKVLADV